MSDPVEEKIKNMSWEELRDFTLNGDFLETDERLDLMNAKGMDEVLHLRKQICERYMSSWMIKNIWNK